MKMEFLDATDAGMYPDASPKFLVRLSDFADSEKLELIKLMQENLLEENKPLILHQLPFIQAINCSVAFHTALEDQGLIKTGSKNEFSCLLTSSSFQDMIDIIGNVDSGYNWLTPGEYLDEPAFLISKYGTW